MRSAAHGIVLLNKFLSSRRTAVLGASALAAWILLFAVLPKDLPFRNDQNVYLSGAAALKAGHGYRFEQYINLPRIGTYPPGYSLWLALFWKDGQAVAVNSYRLELANYIAAGCALFALSAFLSLSEMSIGAAFTVLLLFATSLVFTQLTTWLMSDVLFTAGSCILALLVSAYRSDRTLSFWWLAVGILTGMLYMVKISAVAYIVALVAFGFFKGDFKRRSRLACFAIPTGAVVLVWFLLTRGIPTYATYFGVRISELGGWSGYFLNTLRQAVFYASGRWLVEALLNVPDRLSAARGFLGFRFLAEALAFILGLAFAVPIFLGIRKGPRNAGDQITLFLLAAIALQFFLWPYYLGARAGIAVIPFLMNWLWRGVPSKLGQAALVTLLLVNVPGNAWLSYKTIRTQEKNAPRDLAELRQAAAWINENGGTGASVAAGRDVPLDHFTEYLGRRVLANARPIGGNEYADASPTEQDNHWADYVVNDPSFDPTGWDQERYRIRRVFGSWTVLSRPMNATNIGP
jgi:hypothetical protein